MPLPFEVNADARILPSAHRYLHIGGDTVYAGDDQGTDGITNERKVEEGDWIDSDHRTFAVAVGTARLMQYSYDELDPEPRKSEAKPEPKPKSKKSKKK